MNPSLNTVSHANTVNPTNSSSRNTNSDSSITLVSPTPSLPRPSAAPSSANITVAETVQPISEQDSWRNDEQLFYKFRSNNNTSQHLCRFYAQARCTHGR